MDDLTPDDQDDYDTLTLDEAKAMLRERDDTIADQRAELDRYRNLVISHEEDLVEAEITISRAYEYADDMSAIYETLCDNFNDWHNVEGIAERDREALAVIEAYEELRREHARIAPQVTAKPARGRPYGASDTQASTVLKLHAAGKSLRGIAAATGLSFSTVRTVIAKQKARADTKKRELSRAAAARYRMKLKARQAGSKPLGEAIDAARKAGKRHRQLRRDQFGAA